MKSLIFFSFFVYSSFGQSLFPKVSLLDLDNNSISIQKIVGDKKVVVINFWAEWCTSCIKEIPELNKLKKKYKDILFIAVNAGDKKKKIIRFLKRYPFDFLQLRDADKSFSKKFKVESLPQTFIIKNNRVVYHKFTPPQLKEIDSILVD